MPVSVSSARQLDQRYHVQNAKIESWATIECDIVVAQISNLANPECSRSRQPVPTPRGLREFGYDRILGYGEI